MVVTFGLQMGGTFSRAASDGWITCWILCLVCLFYFFLWSPAMTRTSDQEAICCKEKCTNLIDSCFPCMLTTKPTKGQVQQNENTDEEIKSVQRFIGLKLFVILVIIAMTSSLWFIDLSNEDLPVGWTVAVVFIMIIMCN